MATINIEDICSLTEFLRNTKGYVKKLSKTKRPTVLTVNGKASVVVQDAAAYQAMMDAIDRAEAIGGIQRGLASMERGEGIPASEAFSRLRKKHKIKR